MQKLIIPSYLLLIANYLLLTGCISYHKQQLQLKNNWQNKYQASKKIETEHFIFYVPEGDKVDTTAQEAFYDYITAIFKIEPKEKIVYIKCKNRKDFRKITGQAKFVAVTYPNPYQVNTIISYQQWDDHELIHIIQGLISRGTRFFIEGLAEAYQLSSYLFNDPREKFLLHSYVQNRIIEGGYYVSITKMLTSKKFSRASYYHSMHLLLGTTYVEAGSFVRYLIDNYGGLEKFFQFLKLSDFSDSKAKIEKKFLNVYDLSIQEMEQQWLKFLKENY